MPTRVLQFIVNSFKPPLVVCFQIWIFSLPNFNPFYFQGVNAWRRESQENVRTFMEIQDLSRDDEDEVKIIIWDLS